MLNIRNEEPNDYETVENITRNAFYNLYMPGCVEHYGIWHSNYFWIAVLCGMMQPEFCPELKIVKGLKWSNANRTVFIIKV